MLAFGTPGLFGKIPAAGDFVRVRSTDPTSLALARWLEDGSELAARAGATLGPSPVRFLFRPPGGARALLGVVAGSSDKVGRRFPLAVFAPVDGPELAKGFQALPAAARTFLDGAAALVAEAAGLAAADLAARLPSLPLPEPADLSREVARAEEVARASSAQELLGRLFGDAASGQHLYALHCLRSACQPLRGREPSGPAVVLDCPAQGDLDRFAWLDLARRALGWGGAPSFFWTEPPARLLLGLGLPPPSILPALWDPARRDSKLWPLTTSQPSAIATAKKALGPENLRLLERAESTVADLTNHLHR